MSKSNDGEKKLRRLRHLMYSAGPPLFPAFERMKPEDALKRDLEAWMSISKSKFYEGSKSRGDRREVYSLILELKLDLREAYEMWWEQHQKRSKSRQLQKPKPLKEGRDNKGVYVGSGGSNRNKVRYPSAKRSKRVWKIFYSMFPYYAEKDGWDGHKSSRYNPENNKR